MRVLRLSKEKMYVCATYDISSTKKRNKVVSLFESYWFRVQKSVFEIQLNESQYVVLKKQLKRILSPRYKKKEALEDNEKREESGAMDSIKFYILSKAGEWNLENRIDGLGEGYQKVYFEDVMIL